MRQLLLLCGSPDMTAPTTTGRTTCLSAGLLVTKQDLLPSRPCYQPGLALPTCSAMEAATGCGAYLPDRDPRRSWSQSFEDALVRLVVAFPLCAKRLRYTVLCHINIASLGDRKTLCTRKQMAHSMTWPHPGYCTVHGEGMHIPICVTPAKERSL